MGICSKTLQYTYAAENPRFMSQAFADTQSKYSLRSYSSCWIGFCHSPAPNIAHKTGENSSCAPQFIFALIRFAIVSYYLNDGNVTSLNSSTIYFICSLIACTRSDTES